MIAQGLLNNLQHNKLLQKMVANWELFTYHVISFIHSRTIGSEKDENFL